MKNITFTSVLLTATLLAAPLLSSADVDPGEVTMNVVGHNAFRPELQRVIAEGTREIISNYLLERGIILQEQLDEWKAARSAAREELRALRESGDFEALRERVSELRQEWSERRAQFREYVAQNEELRQQLLEFRQGVRQNFRDRIRDHIEQVRNQTDESTSE